MRHRPQVKSPKNSDGKKLHAADFWTWSSGYGQTCALRAACFCRSSRRPRVPALGPSLISADALSTPTRPTWPRSRLVIGEPCPASPRGFHRTYADRAARSHMQLLHLHPQTSGAFTTLTCWPSISGSSTGKLSRAKMKDAGSFPPFRAPFRLSETPRCWAPSAASGNAKPIGVVHRRYSRAA
jgi:hypothetical protein